MGEEDPALPPETRAMRPAVASLVLLAAQLVYLAVAGANDLRALAHEAGVRISASGSSGIHQVGETVLHGGSP